MTVTMANRRDREKVEQAVIAAYRDGTPVPEIVDQFGFSGNGSVYWILHKHGVKTDRLAKPDPSAPSTLVEMLERIERLVADRERLRQQVRDLGGEPVV